MFLGVSTLTFANILKREELAMREKVTGWVS